MIALMFRTGSPLDRVSGNIILLPFPLSLNNPCFSRRCNSGGLLNTSTGILWCAWRPDHRVDLVIGFSQQLRIIFKPPNINPLLLIGCKLIQIIPTQQPNRVLIDETSSIRLVIPEEVVMQPRFTVTILALQSERLMRIFINPLILFQMTSAGVVAEP